MPKPRRRFRRLVWLAVIIAMVGYYTVAASVLWVRWGAAGHIHTEQEVPAAPVALVLGAQVDPGGSPSVFLTARLDLARRLYESGKVRAILVSGDHMYWDYDEPDAMRTWLIDHGVPEAKIVRDYAGFDTYDSCARAVRIFGVTRAIVVTQAFHVERAVTICRHLGLDADGVGDESVRQFGAIWRSNALREIPAAVKAAYDMTSGRDPVHLGRHETGVDEALRDG